MKGNTLRANRIEVLCFQEKEEEKSCLASSLKGSFTLTTLYSGQFSISTLSLSQRKIRSISFEQTSSTFKWSFLKERAREGFNVDFRKQKASKIG